MSEHDRVYRDLVLANLTATAKRLRFSALELPPECAQALFESADKIESVVRDVTRRNLPLKNLQLMMQYTGAPS